MKKSFTPALFALAAALAFSTSATAYGPQGPYQNLAELSAEWDTFYPSSAAYLYLDGNLVYSRGGFGPADHGNYVTCSDSRIHKDSCPTSVPEAIVCGCEHYGSQYDGLCEVNGYPTPLNGDETFLWTPYRQAFIVWSSPTSNFAVYDVFHGQTGSLNVTVNFSNGQSKSTMCVNGT